MGITMRGINRLQKSLERRKRQFDREQKSLLDKAGAILTEDFAEHVRPAKKVNQQDAPGGRIIRLSGRTPVRKKIERSSNTVAVRVLRYWTRVRAQGTQEKTVIREAFARAGKRSKLYRSGLYVDRSALGWSRSRFVSLKGFVRFRDDPGLLAWAQRTDRGYQYLRHVVRLNDPVVLKRLTVFPAVAKAYPEILALWKGAFGKVMG